jgi:hypothetical protein
VDHLEGLSNLNSELDAKDLMLKYNLDIITNAGLGVNLNSFKDPENLIRKNVS